MRTYPTTLVVERGTFFNTTTIHHLPNSCVNATSTANLAQQHASPVLGLS